MLQSFRIDFWGTWRPFVGRMQVKYMNYRHIRARRK